MSKIVNHKAQFKHHIIYINVVGIKSKNIFICNSVYIVNGSGLVHNHRNTGVMYCNYPNMPELVECTKEEFDEKWKSVTDMNLF